MIPLLTGLKVTELNLSHESSMDNLPLIWKNFSREGYATFYSEDAPQYSTFNYLLRGFSKQPTDHYMRPFQLGLYMSVKMNYSKITEYCYNGKTRHAIQINYLKQFLQEYTGKRRFALFMARCH